MSTVCNKYREVSDISFLLVHFFPSRSHRLMDGAGEPARSLRDELSTSTTPVLPGSTVLLI
jgi:hypothetical protein